MRDVVVVLLQDGFQFGRARDSNLGTGFLLAEVDVHDFLCAHHGHCLPFVFRVGNVLDPALCCGLDILLLDVVVVGNALRRPDTNHKDIAHEELNRGQLLIGNGHNLVKFLSGQIDGIHIDAGSLEAAVLVFLVMVVALTLCHRHDHLELFDAFPDGIGLVVLLGQPGGVILIEFHVDVIEVVLLLHRLLEELKFLDCAAIGFEGAFGIDLPTETESFAGPRILVELLDEFVEGHPLCSSLGRSFLFLSFALSLTGLPELNVLNDLLEFFLSDAVPLGKSGVKGEPEFIDLLCYLRVLLQEIAHLEIALLGIVPGFDVNLDIRGRFVIDALLWGLESHEESCVTRCLGRAEKE